MIREASALVVRQQLGELLNEVQHGKGNIVVTKAGRPVAALVDIAMFERMRKLDEEFDRMRGEIAHAFADSTVDEVQALTDEAVHAARGHRGA